MEYIYHNSYVVPSFAECVHTFHYVTHIGVRSAVGYCLFVIHIILCTKVCILSIQAQQMMATSAFTRSDLHFV